MKRISGLIGLGFLAFSLASCGGGGDSTSPPPPPPPPPPPTCPSGSVCMLASTFSPTTLTVTAGTSVNFTNNSGVTHNVVFDAGGAADIPANNSGTTARTFATAGTYPFHCDFHAPGMKGQIVVQ